MSTYKKGARKQLAKNFKLSEFDCHGKGCCSVTKIDTAFIKQLQGFRDYLNVRLKKNVQINVNSGYRCEKHNTSVGGSSTSKHCYGRAADIVVKANGKSISAKNVCAYAQDYGFDGIGYINSTSTHIDNRGYRWWADETKNNCQTSDFYEYFANRRESNPYMQPAPAIKKGSNGDGVKWLQWYLYCLRYYTGKISGICDSATIKALKAFQKERGLVVDGSCGPLTKRQLNIVW